MHETERSLAYDFACSIIEGECIPMGDGWFTCYGVKSHDADGIQRAINYLYLRGLSESDPDDVTLFCLRDESEATN